MKLARVAEFAFIIALEGGKERSGKGAREKWSHNRMRGKATNSQGIDEGEIEKYIDSGWFRERESVGGGRITKEWRNLSKKK